MHRGILPIKSLFRFFMMLSFLNSMNFKRFYMINLRFLLGFFAFFFLVFFFLETAYCYRLLNYNSVGNTIFRSSDVFFGSLKDFSLAYPGNYYRADVSLFLKKITFFCFVIFAIFLFINLFRVYVYSDRVISSYDQFIERTGLVGKDGLDPFTIHSYDHPRGVYDACTRDVSSKMGLISVFEFFSPMFSTFINRAVTIDYFRPILNIMTNYSKESRSNLFLLKGPASMDIFNLERLSGKTFTPSVLNSCNFVLTDGEFFEYFLIVYHYDSASGFSLFLLDRQGLFYTIEDFFKCEHSFFYEDRSSIGSLFGEGANRIMDLWEGISPKLYSDLFGLEYNRENPELISYNPTRSIENMNIRSTLSQLAAEQGNGFLFKDYYTYKHVDNRSQLKSEFPTRMGRTMKFPRIFYARFSKPISGLFGAAYTYFARAPMFSFFFEKVHTLTRKANKRAFFGKNLAFLWLFGPQTSLFKPVKIRRDGFWDIRDTYGINYVFINGLTGRLSGLLQLAIPSFYEFVNGTFYTHRIKGHVQNQLFRRELDLCFTRELFSEYNTPYGLDHPELWEGYTVFDLKFFSKDTHSNDIHVDPFSSAKDPQPYTSPAFCFKLPDQFSHSAGNMFSVLFRTGYGHYNSLSVFSLDFYEEFRLRSAYSTLLSVLELVSVAGYLRDFYRDAALVKIRDKDRRCYKYDTNPENVKYRRYTYERYFRKYGDDYDEFSAQDIPHIICYKQTFSSRLREAMDFVNYVMKNVYFNELTLLVLSYKDYAGHHDISFNSEHRYSPISYNRFYRSDSFKNRSGSVKYSNQTEKKSNSVDSKRVNVVSGIELFVSVFALIPIAFWVLENNRLTISGSPGVNANFSNHFGILSSDVGQDGVLLDNFGLGDTPDYHNTTDQLVDVYGDDIDISRNELIILAYQWGWEYTSSSDISSGVCLQSDAMSTVKADISELGELMDDLYENAGDSEDLASIEDLLDSVSEENTDIAVTRAEHQILWSEEFITGFIFQTGPNQGVTVMDVGRTGITLSSFDVIHSFALPTIGIKEDCVPGNGSKRLDFEGDSVGYFTGMCSELCGREHARMSVSFKFVGQAGHYDLDDPSRFFYNDTHNNMDSAFR